MKGKVIDLPKPDQEKIIEAPATEIPIEDGELRALQQYSFNLDMAEREIGRLTNNYQEQLDRIRSKFKLFLEDQRNFVNNLKVKYKIIGDIKKIDVEKKSLVI